MPYVITTTPQEVGAMPNQIYGTLNGVPFYFRALHGAWALHLKEPDKHVVESRIIASGEGGPLGRHGELPGWWKAEDVLAFCEHILKTLVHVETSR